MSEDGNYWSVDFWGGRKGEGKNKVAVKEETRKEGREEGRKGRRTGRKGREGKGRERKGKERRVLRNFSSFLSDFPVYLPPLLSPTPTIAERHK
jgi:hypothetical protein